MSTTKKNGERRITIVVRRSFHKKLKLESTRKELTIFELLDQILAGYFDNKSEVKNE